MRRRPWKQSLLEHGHAPAAPGEIADAVIVNTCAVTAEAGANRARPSADCATRTPGAVIAVCGRYSAA